MRAMIAVIASPAVIALRACCCYPH